MNAKAGRNDPCSCGSGKKYKNCCMGKSKPAGLAGRKFTAKVITSGGQKPEESEATQQKNITVDYHALMGRSFGDAFSSYKDSPPIPDNPEDYLGDDSEKE